MKAGRRFSACSVNIWKQGESTDCHIRWQGDRTHEEGLEVVLLLMQRTGGAKANKRAWQATTAAPPKPYHHQTAHQHLHAPPPTPPTTPFTPTAAHLDVKSGLRRRTPPLLHTLTHPHMPCTHTRPPPGTRHNVLHPRLPASPPSQHSRAPTPPPSPSHTPPTPGPHLAVKAVCDAAVAGYRVPKVLDLEAALEARGEEAAKGGDEGGEERQGDLRAPHVAARQSTRVEVWMQQTTG